MGDLTASRARALLDRHDLRLRRGLGQHLLVDPNTVRRIVRLAELAPSDTVVEAGPGLGSLTVELARAVARVVAIELDEGLAPALAEVTSAMRNVEVVLGDAARIDLAAFGRARLVSNLPYGAATPILAHVLDDAPEIASGLVMVQREVGERWTSPPGSRTYGAISVKVAFHADARIVGDVPRTVFLPPPNVDSVLVSFARRALPAVDVDDPRAFLDLVARVFGHRRKTIRNALAAAGADPDAPARAGVDPRARPEQLGLRELAAVYSVARPR